MTTLKKRNRKPKFESPEKALLSRLPLGSAAECWEWPAARTKHGYGVFTHQHKQYYAHRVAYAVFHGPIPDGMDICHTCDNPACCNLDHLWAGTPADNARDMVSKGRGKGKVFRGEDHPMSKLTADEASAIRKLADEGMNQMEIARQFGVSQSTVMGVRTRRTWKHLVP
jgi:hypothetical protein